MKHSHFLSKILACLLAAGLLLCTGCGYDPPGRDWRTWRGYSSDLSLSEGIVLTFSDFVSEQDPECKGFGVYDAETGMRVGTILLSREDTRNLSHSFDFQAEDRDGDGIAEIGIPLNNGTVLWYRYGYADTWQENVLELAERSVSGDNQ